MIMKKNQAGILDMKNSVESMGSKDDQSEERLSRLEDKLDVVDKVLNDKIKTSRPHENWITRWLDDFLKSNNYKS